MDYIKDKIKDKRAKPMGIKNEFSVIAPLLYVDGEIHLLYEVRAKHLNRQPNEISFPGGKVEDGETFKEAAIRETYEELNIDKSNIRLIGELDYIPTPYNFHIHSYLAELKNIERDNIRYSIDEVDHIFTVPIKFFLRNNPKLYYANLETFVEEDFPYDLIPNGKNYKWKKGRYPVYFYKYKEYIIWGITARITKNLIDHLLG
ncbi:NUDIX hydrolase [Dethiothermospora halolimnae]|uniref:NUDIX hydrolase n=1 Tax=Dethiothermospora halolimnae TaxID=3114390 RepID=UPI003CCBCBD9